MTTYCDLGGLSWSALFTYNGKGYVDRLMFEHEDLFLCSDSSTSIRRQYYHSYKTARLGTPPEQLKRREQAHELQWWACGEYAHRCIGTEGLEADDIMAREFQPGDTLMTNDKDLLQVTGAKLIDFGGKPWGFERLQKKIKVDISSPALFLLYQVMYGDVTDDVRRILASKDRKTGPWILSQPVPIDAACAILPLEMLRDNLNLVMLPTPLITGQDPIEAYRKRYT